MKTTGLVDIEIVAQFIQWFYSYLSFEEFCEIFNKPKYDDDIIRYWISAKKNFIVFCYDHEDLAFYIWNYWKKLPKNRRTL